MPTEGFVQQLETDDVPDKVSVVGLDVALKNADLIANLSRSMDQRATDLEYQNPTVQFVVEGSFHRNGKTYDLRYDGELYPLQDVFGPQLDRKGNGDWLIAPF
nr:hypothetical protein [Natronococcus pandeyae]